MIEVENLSKQFNLTRQQKKELGGSSSNGFVDAVAGISFTCQPGRVFSLLGANGAKTTTLRMIATMLEPTSGTIRVQRNDVKQEPKEVSLGFLTGTNGLYDCVVLQHKS